MKPVDQIHTDLPGTGAPPGDCLRACVASVLELEPYQVPHFVELSMKISGYNWPVELAAWLAKRDLVPQWWSGPPGGFDGHAIVTGPSPRGDWNHAVVARVEPTGVSQARWSMVHDPHPSRAGLASYDDVEFLILESLS